MTQFKKNHSTTPLDALGKQAAEISSAIRLLQISVDEIKWLIRNKESPGWVDVSKHAKVSDLVISLLSSIEQYDANEL